MSSLCQRIALPVIRLVRCASTLGARNVFKRPENPWRAPKYAHRDGPTPEQYRVHRQALKEKHPEGWLPPRKLSREAMDGLRALHHHDPKTFSTPVLANKFRISPEAVRRILKSKWAPSREREMELVAKEKAVKQVWYESKVRHEYEADPQGDRPVRQPGDGLSLTEDGTFCFHSSESVFMSTQRLGHRARSNQSHTCRGVTVLLLPQAAIAPGHHSLPDAVDHNVEYDCNMLNGATSLHITRYYPRSRPHLAEGRKHVLPQCVLYLLHGLATWNCPYFAYDDDDCT